MNADAVIIREMQIAAYLEAHAVDRQTEGNQPGAELYGKASDTLRLGDRTLAIQCLQKMETDFAKEALEFLQS